MKDKLFTWYDGKERGILLQFVVAFPGTIWGMMLMDNGEVLPVPSGDLTYVGPVEYK